MPAIRPQSTAAVVRSVSRQPQQTLLARRQRPFSSTPARPASHESHYDPPTGWLFGVKPGEKYQKEGWEGPFFYGFCGSLAVFAIAYAFKPDTSIQTWALEEARRRLEAEGILEDPENKKA
ncbi:hypothetical protein VTK73DRAFT_778 [Phialemonium thermophilum]|uniref:NADH dehydrogenase [ubiquinone] 1 beta subcomplex subunit 11, mitochondrial n=1 Tax=Phialemonium thermophilum TaxID=223376 RepID=A0ABR3VUB2_9PEZI